MSMLQANLKIPSDVFEGPKRLRGRDRSNNQNPSCAMFICSYKICEKHIPGEFGLRTSMCKELIKDKVIFHLRLDTLSENSHQYLLSAPPLLILEGKM